MKPLAGQISALLFAVPFLASLPAPAFAQPVTPAPDGTGTTVTPQGNTFNIQGGSLSRDGANLFHSFQKFGLSEGQIANFLSSPDIRNILGRVIGGDASYINGLIRVSGGNSNLFLMNPAGIVFGPNASLNVPASFTGTTATGIGFGSGWFNAVGSNDYNLLVGTPSAFNFAVSQPGAIVNEGNLSLTPGSNLALLGGTVINTGTLTSPGGNISIAAVPGDSSVRISQEGHLLSLDIEPAALGGAEVKPVLQPLSLPQLLTGRPDFGHASALSVSETGEVSLTGSGVRIVSEGGIIAGNIDTSSEVGNGGAIALNATSDIITGSLRTAAGGTGTGGNIAISSSAGGINTSAGALDASSYDGNGGNVALSAERDIITGEIKSGSVGEIISLGSYERRENGQVSYKGGAGTGGNITLESRSGALDTSAGNLSSYSFESDGGSVTLSAFGDIKTGGIASSSGFAEWKTEIRLGTGTGTGGNIGINSRAGAIDTSSSRLDSSSFQGNGGAVTLRASGDIKTGGISSFSSGYYDLNTGTMLGTGSGGNIELNSSAGGIDASGGGLISYSSQANGGSVTLRASGDIKTGSVVSFSNGTGSGGNIEFNTSAGGIDTGVGGLFSYSSQGNGGSVTLRASGDIKIGSISSISPGYYDPKTGTQVGTGSGGDIELNSSNGAIDTSSGGLDSSSNQGNGGAVTLTASGDIKTGPVLSFSKTGSGGNIEINSGAGAIDTSSNWLDSSSKEGNGGAVTLTADGDIKAGNISAASQGAGSGGNIALHSRAGGIDSLWSELSSNSNQGDGGAVTLTASGDIKIGGIWSSSEGAGSGGEIRINSSAGGIDIGERWLSSRSRQGDGGSISLTAFGDIKTSNIWSYSQGAGSGGNIALNSRAGGINTTNSTDPNNGKLESYSSQGRGGSIALNASGTAVTRGINSSGLLRGGDITLTSQLSDIINLGFLDSSSKNGANGTIAVSAFTGSISTGNLSGARNIAIAGGGKEDPLGGHPNPGASVTYSAGKINTLGGNVTLSAHNDITVTQPIKTDSISSLELIAGRSINIRADIDTSGSNGNITLRANSNSANPKYRDSGAGSVTMAPGTALNAGSGNIAIELGRLGQVGDITLGNINTAGALTVSAGTGNILRSSADSLIQAGSAFFGTATSGAGGIGLLAGPLRISVRNLEATAGSGGAFFESPEGGLTVGGATNLPTGIVTGGGGDVSVSAAGDMTVTEPVSTASVLAGDAGNITLNSTGGFIDTSATTLNSSAAQGNGGSVTLTASGDIKTSGISSYSEGSGTGGNIALNSLAGGIDTTSKYSGLSSRSNYGNGGSVTLTAYGDIKISNIWSSSLYTGSGGDISLNSRGGGIDTTLGVLSSPSGEGNGGAVTLRASGDIKTANIFSYSGYYDWMKGTWFGTGSGGNIELNSSAGAIDTSSGMLSSYSYPGNGGSVTLRASGDIKIGRISSYSEGTGSGGDISINSGAGAIDAGAGDLSSYSSQGNAGSVTLRASGDIQTGQIQSMAGFKGERACETCELKFTPIEGSTGTGGDITVGSSNGAVNTSTGSLNTMSSGGVAGNVNISAAGHVEIRDIRSDGFLQGGNIAIRSDSSNSISAGGNLDTYSTNGTAGDITLSSPGAITLTGDITSYGRTESGDITVTSASNNVTTNSITTQSGNGPSGNISINGNNIAAGNLDSIGSTGAGNIQVRAGGSVTTLNIESRTDEGDSGNIDVGAGGDINTGDQTSSTNSGDSGDITNTAGGDLTAGSQTTSTASGNSGNINNTAGGDLTAGNQTTSATNGNSGNISNSAGNNITAGNQTTSATNGNSGNITNTAGGNISTGNQTSSATGGTAGNITSTAGGSINTGNITSTGTSGSGNITLNSGSGQINTGAIHTDTGEVNISGSVNPVPVPVPAPTNPVPVPSATETEPVLPNTLNHSVSSDSSINPNVSGSQTSTPSNQDTPISRSSAQQILSSLSALNSSPMAVNSAEAIAQIEQRRGREFANYFGEDISNQLTSTESIRDALATIASQTGNRSAIIYVTALPEELEVVVLTPEGKLVRKTVPGAKSEGVLAAVKAFRSELTNPRKRNTTSYLKPAQQLYQSLIAPIEPELQAAKIDTLLFSMDAGLRGLPVAALHDGKQFLVEKYSLALIPSVSLMDTRYQPVRGKQVLAMGASEFPDKQPLPGVPVELSEITQKVWQGKAFLNQDFTQDNLMGQRSNYPYSMIHLATHAEFQPGEIGNSYIQLWDDKVHLDELRKLRLNSPPVELLVLSACRTAVGDEKAELGFAGFAVAAGVKSAVASLWYVSDAGTLALMTEFYRHLADAKIKAEALRQAQLAMIRGEVRIEGGELLGSKELGGVPLPAELLNEGEHVLSHPYYWSSFTMIGSPW